MNWKKAGIAAGVSAGVFLGMKYVFPVILPFFLGWILAEAVHVPAKRICEKQTSKKLHLSETALGMIFIILGVLLAVLSVLFTLQYLTGKLGECVQYYPELKEEAQDILWKLCLGIERLTGISADKSCFYISRQAELFLRCIFSGKNSMNTAMVSVKGCVCFVGILAICIVFAILFLQERERVYASLEKWKIFGNLIHIIREMVAGIKAYLKAAGAAGFNSWVVNDPGQAKKVNSYLTEGHLPLLKDYSVFCLIKDFSPCLTPEIRDSTIAWSNAQKGIQGKKTDKKLAGELVQNTFGFEFGRLYVEKHFSEEDKKNVETLVHQILAAYEDRINGLDWMGEATKEKAIRKLEHMTLKIGYPDHWPDYYENAVILPEGQGSLVDNMVNVYRSLRSYEKEEIKKPVDRTQWGMTPQTVNAYYNPLNNEIVFPAAILQPPFYDPNADDASNLGGIGMVIAHEISHAFDSSGARYDENGNYNMWWTEDDLKKFQDLTLKVAAYYDGQEAVKGRYVNGRQTLNENIADLGALACVTSIAGDDTEALNSLFTQYARIWASKYTEESMIHRLNTDVHSPAKVRVNAVLSSTEAFYKVYPDLKEGDGMYAAPEKRVKIW